ncbi:MBL fold metallo-hydrolase [Luteolibacter marinus]|uniref:MBL fold metallo-hydrolase n=1 Tax=Luteolibacter marinus TaxID=2776705 RepID=UPI001865DE7E|nr:MBL fold metallo-hydrolase [Luteolibacter marinus]
MSRRFSNPWIHDEHRFRDVLRWKLGRSPADPPSAAPDRPAPAVPIDLQPAPPAGWRVTWLGHASFLLQGCGRNLLVDPVFSDHCAPLPLPSLRRHVEPPCRIDQLPKIDGVLLTHSHYDHLDLPTLVALGRETPLVVAEGHAGWLGRKGFREVREIPWFGTAEFLPGLQVTATPAQHFTARTPFDRNRGHWCGWLIEGGGFKLWHAGDSGHCPAFGEIGMKLGPIDFAMIPIGAYAPRWFMKPMHMTPEEAVRVFRDARCRRAVAMHWGTFRLTDEPLGEPPLRLAAEVERAGIPAGNFVAGAVGESWSVT